jgi:hypothetical protein
VPGDSTRKAAVKGLNVMAEMTGSDAISSAQEQKFVRPEVLGLKHAENVLTPGMQVFVIGNVVAIDHGGSSIRGGKGPFIISTKSEAALATHFEKEVSDLKGCLIINVFIVIGFIIWVGWTAVLAGWL